MNSRVLQTGAQSAAIKYLGLSRAFALSSALNTPAVMMPISILAQTAVMNIFTGLIWNMIDVIEDVVAVAARIKLVMPKVAPQTAPPSSPTFIAAIATGMVTSEISRTGVGIVPKVVVPITIVIAISIPSSVIVAALSFLLFFILHQLSYGFVRIVRHTYNSTKYRCCQELTKGGRWAIINRGNKSDDNGAVVMRIDKFISSQRTDLSRGDVKKLIRAGRVTADGAVVKSPEHKVSETAEVAVDGEVITYKEHIYLMLNKPQGYVCSAKEGSSPTVYELVPPQFRRRGLFPAGRLDKDTVGFVLMTDDGQLAHEMLSPVHHVPKTYIVTLEGPYREDYENSFAEGLVIDGGEKCLPAELSPVEGEDRVCRLVLHEGKFHQVKRMFEAVGNRVVFLQRVKIGGLDLCENLALGECLEIMHKDVEKLLAGAGTD